MELHGLTLAVRSYALLLTGLIPDDSPHTALLLPYPARNLGAEIVLLLFLALLDAIRIFLGQYFPPTFSNCFSIEVKNTFMSMDVVVSKIGVWSFANWY